MTDIIRLKVNGEGVFAETHVQGVEGLQQFVDDKLVEAGAGSVSSVNGKVGVVELNAEDVGALPSDTVIPEYSLATSGKDGLMSKADKAKLDDLSVATEEKDGLMSKADKAKLDGLPNILFEVVGTVDDSE